MHVGLIIMDENPADALRVARLADRAGVQSIWTIDYYNRSSLTRAAVFAASTESTIVGTSVTPLFARAPLTLAAAAADIQVLAGGRFVLGVGSSTRRMNSDWYGVALEHPAPQLIERVRLVRELIGHVGGRYTFDGRFDHLTMAHFDRDHPPEPVSILGAAVGERMVCAVGQCADGYVGHPIAPVEYLATIAPPLLASGRGRSGSPDAPVLMSSQIIAAASDDVDRARATAAAQVGFYSTVKGYAPLFPGNAHSRQREDARAAFERGDVAGTAAAAMPMVEERAVFGRPEDLAAQLNRYDDCLDWALLYPPDYGVEADELTSNELALIEVAAAWPK